jgi:hypothetical protein
MPCNDSQHNISWANKLSLERKLFLVIQKIIWLSFGMKYLRSVIKGAKFWSRRILSAAASCICDATTAGDQNRTMNGIIRGRFILKRERERERKRVCVVIDEAFINLHLCKTVNETIVAVEHIVSRPFMLSLSLGQCLKEPPAAPSSRLWRISGYSASGRSFFHFFSCGCTYSTYE